MIGIKSALNVFIPWRIPFINLGQNSSIEDKYTGELTHFLSALEFSDWRCIVYGKGIDVISYVSVHADC